ncbi:cobalt ECF transporter T component CbiQ [Alkalinema pantanalense CENA528]|uniref:cobalt ECF transporter T component CbiQ n=1 Tax=Alkalinema pantanalense TaxID=1620705 RepID=UPI003D7016C5
MILHGAVLLGQWDSSCRVGYAQPWMRVICATISVFAIALTHQQQGWQLTIIGLGLLLLCGLSSVSAVHILKRLTVELGFALVLALGTLFREQGDLLWQWSGLKIYQGGLLLFCSLASKVVLSLIALNLLTLTTSQVDLLQALKQLKIPPLLVAIVGSMLRYLAVLLEEAQTLQRAAQSRNLLLSRLMHRRVVGMTIGTLFIRTYDRGDRIYQAMLSRGYSGLVTEDIPLRWTKPDSSLLSYTIGVILVSMGVDKIL